LKAFDSGGTSSREIEAKLAFLRSPQSYPDSVRSVSTIETHMSWVFLTEADAWKLKKPVRTEYLDFSTAEARLRNCRIEVRLNRRLAPDVYRGIVPMTSNGHGRLALGGNGAAVDWLVRMRRLPAERMLDRAIAEDRVSEEDSRAVGRLLGTFYRNARSVPISGEEYRLRLNREVEANRQVLSRRTYGLPPALVEPLCDWQAGFIRDNPRLFDERAGQRKIVEAHGDLRPEHICLESVPVVIDCLEFNEDLRILDPAAELSFLALECERLGARRVAELILEASRGRTGDDPPASLSRFYRSHQAALRAKVAIWHLEDAATAEPGAWVSRSVGYLQIASRSTREPSV
jgi:aminoglycoside phosphotransferase family enzyme